MTLSEAFAQLGLPPDSDGRAVRRAYAQLLKGLDQVSQPQAFMELRAAYELAMAHVRANANVQELGTQAQLNEPQADAFVRDRKSTRLNSSHLVISYAVFCLKKKK